MATPRRGEVWLVDFGLAGKTRPALVVSVPFGDQDRSLITVVPHTTSLRGSSFEIVVQVPFLKPGAFLVQGVTTFPTVRALHRLGSLEPDGFEKVFEGLLRWLGRS
jgi:mRNA interferase MazF